MKIKTLLIALISPLFVIAQPNSKTIAPAQMQQELAILQKALTTLHPGIYRYETPQQIQAIFQSAQKKVQQPLRESCYLILIAQLLTHVHCGHTYTNYWNQPKQVSNALYSPTYIPVLYRIIAGKMIVTHNLSANAGIKPGDEVVAINHVTVKQIIDSLLTVSPSDGLHGLPRKLDNISIRPLDADTGGYNLFDIYMPLFFPANFNTPGYVLKIRHFNSTKDILISVASLSKKERLLAYNNRFGTLPVHDKNWSLKMLNLNTACFTIGDFETWEWKGSYKKYLDSIFTVLDNKKIKNLVIDIRGNGGGDDAARDEVCSYLANHPFGCTDPMLRRFRFLAVPDTLLPYLQTWDRTFKQPKNPDDYIKNADGLYENKAELNAACVAITPKPNRFAGRKFLITDGRNSSTTFTLAKLFKTGHIGEIIGECTGGNQQGIDGGQFFFLNLPYSKIEVDIPLVWGAYSGTPPDTGIKPDQMINTTRRSIALDKDPQLQYILSHIADNHL